MASATAFNRTSFGIEISANLAPLSSADAFNRTSFGIEMTTTNRLCKPENILLIVPVLELK